MLPTLQYISKGKNPKEHLLNIEHACKQDIQLIQLRIKDESKNIIISAAQEARIITKKYNAKLLINDYLDVAIAVHADGVHIGQEDTPYQTAREILGTKAIIGVTANTYQEIESLWYQCHEKPLPTYIGLGPYAFTTTKKKLKPVLGLEGYIDIIKTLKKKEIDIPIFAVGGIQDISTVQALRNIGVYGIAASSMFSIL